MIKLLKIFSLSILIIGLTIAFNYNSSVSLGSSKNEVAKAMGTPNNKITFRNCETWFYNKSSVTFKNQKVNEWSNLGNLKVSIGKKNLNAEPIAKGSNKKQVVCSMGTPTVIMNQGNRDIWFYETSSVTFENSKVTRWNNKGNLYVSETEQEFTGPDYKTKEEILIENQNALHPAANTDELFAKRVCKGNASMSHLAAANSFYNQFGSSNR